jgi:hypothetical protein
MICKLPPQASTRLRHEKSAEFTAEKIALSDAGQNRETEFPKVLLLMRMQ